MNITITFGLPPERLEKLFQVEKLLGEMGIYFDRGYGPNGRDWEFDWSLEGPVKVTARREESM